jgi:putative transposase
MCRVLGVSRSSYYDWVNRLDQPPPRRVTRDEALVEQIKSVHAAFAYYGSPRVHRELLKREQRAGRHHIARLMRDHGIRARRGRIKSKGRSVLPKRRAEITDQVKRKFDAERPNRLWFTDLTMIRTGQGWLRAAVILDAFNREVISWAVADHETPSTAMNALRDAIAIRRPAAGCVIHSDRGYQYTSHDWLALARENGLVASIGERKSALDNAAMESWFASLKNESIYPAGEPPSRAAARMLLFRYIHVYNTIRMHSTLGYLSPIEYAKLNQQLSV